MTARRVTVPLNELTNHQLLLHLHNRLETTMADLSQSVSDLQAAVDGVAQRFTDQIGPLTQALSDAQAALANLTVQDEADKQALADALASAQTAADSIESQVTELNDIGAAAPADQPPADQPPAQDPGGDAPPPDQPA